MSADIRKRLEKIYIKIDKLAVWGKEKTQEYYLLVDDFVNKGTYQDFELCLFYYYYIDISGINSVDIVKKKTWPEITMQTKATFLKKLSKLYKTKNIYQQGFDIFSFEPKYLDIDLSNPLSSTYSVISSTSSVSFTRDGDLIKLRILNDSVHRVNIYKVGWELVDNIEVPSYTKEIQNVNIIPGVYLYNTEIATTYNQELLIKTEERYVPGLTLSSFKEINYKLSLVKNSLLGQIQEIEDVNSNSFYLNDTKLSKLKKDLKTSLKVDKIGLTSSLIISDDNEQLTYETNLILKYAKAVDFLLS